MKTIATIKNETVTFVYLDLPKEIMELPIKEYLQKATKERIQTYIHNFAVEGSMLTPYLLKNGYKHVTKAPTEENTFFKTEGDDGSIFNIKIKVGKARAIKFIDSKKILNFKPHELQEAFLSDDKDDNSNELTIIAKCLKIMFDQGHTKETMSSNAFSKWQEIRFTDEDGKVNKARVKTYLPLLDITVDDYIRKSYVGGWVYLNPKLNELQLSLGKSGVTLDVNSLFPSVMVNNPMPWGYPVKFTGQYKENKKHPLYIQTMKIEWLSLKKGKFPFLHGKGAERLLTDTYITDCSNFTVTLTNVDFELLKECYDISGIDGQPGKITYIDGYMFRSISNLFTDYIQYFMDIKNNNTGATKQIAKLFLNSLYGKFGSIVRRRINNFSLDETGKEVKEIESRDGKGQMYYTAISSFICSYARGVTIRGANANYDNFLYADTDSLHLACKKEDVIGLEIHNKNIGCWKLEKEFTDSVYLGLKTYGELDENGWEFKAAGLPKEALENLKDKSEFYTGAEVECKVRTRTPNGVEFISKIFRLAGSKIGKLKH